MKRGNNPLILCLFGILPLCVAWAFDRPCRTRGLPEIVARFPAAMNDPFKIELCEDSLKTVLFLLCAYGLGIGIFLSSRRNYRRGEEHGSARWGNAKAVNKKYRAAKPEENKIFTQNVRMGLGEKKVALFALIPDNDTSFNFLVSILYTQLFQQLFYLADHKYGGSLPVPVYFLMDEFSNVSLPNDFSKILAVMRSRQVLFRLSCKI